MIKGVFLDVGGTLYSYRNLRHANLQLMGTLASRLELEHDVAEVAGHYRHANQQVDRQMAGLPFYLFHDYFELIFRTFLARIERPHLQHHFDWWEEHQRVTLLDALTLQPDCAETLGRLKTSGLYLSAVSNADENILAPLVERGQLHRWLDHWTSSEAARSCKPDRRFFEVALQKSGLSAEQVLFVGDSLEQDIQGAHAIGMTTVLISEADDPAPMHVGRDTPEPDFRISRLSELPGIVERARVS